MPSQSFDKRRLVGILPERITNVSNTDFPGHDPKVDSSWNLSKFKKVRCATRQFFFLVVEKIYALFAKGRN